LRSARRATRIRNQHIDPPESVLGFLNKCPDLVGNGKVCDHRTTNTTRFLDLPTHPRQGVCVATMHADLGTLGRQVLRDHPADTPGRTCDQSVATGKLTLHTVTLPPLPTSRKQAPSADPRAAQGADGVPTVMAATTKCRTPMACRPRRALISRQNGSTETVTGITSRPVLKLSRPAI